MPKFKVMFATFPYGNSECPDVQSWLIKTILKADKDSRIGAILDVPLDDTPITMTRNKAVKAARQEGVDILVMIDNDINPDAYLKDGRSPSRKLGYDSNAKPFWDSSLEFMLNHQGPCLIAAPYCGPPPLEEVYIFHWKNRQSNHPNPDSALKMLDRERAHRSTGIEEVSALPTGLMMLDMRFIKYHPGPPYFYYEWADEEQSEKASTEDCAFTRDCSLAGVKCYVNWDAWCGHYKRKQVSKPCFLTADNMSERYREALNRRPSNERLIDLRPRADEPPATNGVVAGFADRGSYEAAQAMAEQATHPLEAIEP